MLIFLDIDGVMIPAKGWQSLEVMDDGFPAFSARATHALRQLLAEDVTVILTTSHKDRFTLTEWKQIFSNRNIHISKLKSLPGNGPNLNRKQEIENWFHLNIPEEDFVILDDDKSLNELPERLKHNLVQTSSHIGLTEEHVVNICSILNREIAPV